MKLLLAGMHRSGMNCVARWLLRQSFLREAPMDYVYSDWVEHIADYMYMTMINHPEHKVKYQGFLDHYQPSNVIITIEREGMGPIQEFAAIHPDFKPVLVVREFKNWVASVCYMNKPVAFSIPHIDVVKYHSHLLCEDYFKIYYDQWCIDKEYRHCICDQLGLTFTDCGFDAVSPNGGGSSFNGLEFDGRASSMSTTERYKKCEHMTGYKQLLSNYQGVMGLSDEKFSDIRER